MNYRVLIAATLVATLARAGEVDTDLPKPWFKNGMAPAVDQCMAGVDAELENRGTRNLTLKCERDAGGGFVGIMQNFSAEKYHGKRLRFSALVKSEGVEGWGGLWMRIDNTNKMGAAFDNMQQRPINGTRDWTPHAVVLDATGEAQGIFFGVLMSGKGQLWISDLRFEEVGLDVPTTGVTQSSEPGNLQLAR